MLELMKNILDLQRYNQVHSKKWGAEYWIVNNENYCGKILSVNKGAMCSIHYHQLKKETFHILSGKVLFQWANTETAEILGEMILEVGRTVTLPPYFAHRFIGLEDINEILEISTQHFETDSYRLIESKAANE